MGTVTARVTDASGNTVTASATYLTSTQTVPQRIVAVYNSGNNPKMVVSGQAMNGGSGYLRYDQKVSGSTGLSNAISSGARALFVTLDSKHGTTSGPVFDPWSEFTAGTHDTDLTAFRSDAVTLLNAHTNLEIFVSFVHEANLRHYAAGDPNNNKTANDTAATYTPAANHVADLMHAANHPRLKTIHWLCSTGSAAPFLPDKTKFDGVSIDIYKVGDTNHAWTMPDLFTGFADFLVTNGWTTQRRFITETGIKTDLFTSVQQGEQQYTEAEQLAFWDSMPAAMSNATLNLEGLVWFEAMGTNHDYRPVYASIEPEFAQEAALVING